VVVLSGLKVADAAGKLRHGGAGGAYRCRLGPHKHEFLAAFDGIELVAKRGDLRRLGLDLCGLLLDQARLFVQFFRHPDKALRKTKNPFAVASALRITSLLPGAGTGSIAKATVLILGGE
jgi:hypothetical protein